MATNPNPSPNLLRTLLALSLLLPSSSLSPSPSPTPFPAPHISVPKVPAYPSHPTPDGIHRPEPPRSAPTRPSQPDRPPPGARSQSNKEGNKNKPKQFNSGQKLGILFAIVAGAMQFVFVGFLAIKRWQLGKIDRGFRERDRESSHQLM